MLTSCAAAGSPGKSEAHAESQLLDTKTGETFYLGMKKKELKSIKLKKADDEIGMSGAMETFQYEGVNLTFKKGELVMMLVSDASESGRFTNKGLSIGNAKDGISSIYGHQPIHNPYFNAYEFIIIVQQDGSLHYLESLEELKDSNPDNGVYMISFNVNEENKIRSFSIMNEKFLDPGE